MIPLTRPVLGPEELGAVQSVLESGMVAQGPMAAAFEDAVKQRTGSRHAFALSSCTTALHLALDALDIGAARSDRGGSADDEVLAADFSFPATGNAIVQAGARPVLVDIDPATYAMDPGDLERRITPRSRAIMPVHPVGSPAPMDAIMAIADRHGIAVIEDAACALGGSCGGRSLGTIGRIGCLSFHGRKIVTTGEGGMLLTDDDAVAERVALLRTHGGVRDGFAVRFEDTGFNYRLSDIQAAIGVQQMGRLGDLIARRRELALELNARLGGIPDIALPTDQPWGRHLYQSYVVLLGETDDRDAVVHGLRERGVESTLGTYAMHAQPSFMRRLATRPGDLPGSWRAYRGGISLPLFPTMTEAEVETVAETFASVLAGVRDSAACGDAVR